MSYEGELPEEIRKGLGPTGRFPEGQMSEDDEGELRVAIGSISGAVFIHFGDKPIKWVGFSPAQAKQIAAALVQHAERAQQEDNNKEGKDGKGTG